MTKTILIIMSLLTISVLIMISCKGKDKKITSELNEVSTEIDLANFSPFLNKIISLIESGFTSSEIDLIVGEFKELEKDNEKNYDFKIEYNGSESTMKMKVVKEDADIVLFYIYSIPGLSEKINDELSKLMEEKGL